MRLRLQFGVVPSVHGSRWVIKSSHSSHGSAQLPSYPESLFYTKDKSLIFYGYDLDQQPGIKKAGVFQAWGGRGADRQHAVSLGLLYKDDANQKRWVLKSNGAKTISQIDAVFVTFEPECGSTKPSGKPLLFSLVVRKRQRAYYTRYPELLSIVDFRLTCAYSFRVISSQANSTRYSRCVFFLSFFYSATLIPRNRPWLSTTNS